MKEISKAIVKVMQEVKGMEKNSKVGSGYASYDGTKYKDVAEVFNNALEKNGLSMLPIGVEEETNVNRWTEENEYQGKVTIKQKQSVFTKVKTKYLLLHTSGESIELAGYGHGVDPQDKGAGKATTYALKNCLLYTFLTPVGKIDDTDTTHSNEIETKQVVKNKGKQVLTDKGLEYLQEKGTEQEVTKAINERKLTALQKTALKILHNELIGMDATIGDTY